MVQVWPVELTTSDAVISRLRAFLRPEERDCAARFRFEHLQRSYIIARGSLRVLLGVYLDAHPSTIELTYGAKGKPRLVTPLIEFNASHSGKLALFAFTHGVEIGVDIERVRALPDIHNIAKRFFCADEAQELESLPISERDRAFLRCWTRKEAYVKATGEGLSTPLDQFRVTLRPNDPARFICFSNDPEAARSWTLHDLAVASDYVAAVAYRDARKPVYLFPMVQPSDLITYGNVQDLLQTMPTSISTSDLGVWTALLCGVKYPP